jgi:ABC-type hemin transport system ATPase subunit
MPKELNETILIVISVVLTLCLAAAFADEIVLWLMVLNGHVTFIDMPR